MDIVFFDSADAFRQWLVEHHAEARELWVGFYKKGAGQTGISYPEAVDQALCFGWIDGVRRSVDEQRYTNRFTPRTSDSTWSQVNIRRVGELTEQGLMHQSGLDTFKRRKAGRERLYTHEQEGPQLGEYEAQLRASEAAWTFFQAQPPSYRRLASWWVVSAKQEATRQRRMAELIRVSEERRRLPQFSRAAE
ncbi:MAG TPA: YdeI/OmpD-associated family protein [Roseiflexaceae bacterium]|nr:YdeI/OmpD-associated family protein [Roseiflexaceae bacterium]